MTRPAVTIVLPVYNEARALPGLLRALARLRLNADIVAVDDGSTDGSGALLAAWARGRPRVRVLRHPRNRGKGAAVRTGLAAARGRVVVTQDADLETDPRDIPRLLRALAAAPGGAVSGTRFPAGRRSRAPRLTRLANALLTGAANALFGARLTDLACAYKAAPAALLRSLALTADRFDLEAELTAALLRRGVTIVEVPVRYRPRTYGEGKKIHPLDGLRILRTLLRVRLAPG